MKKKFIEKCYSFISKYQTCDELKTKKIKYGLEGLYNLLTKTVVLILLTITFQLFKEFVILLICYTFTRLFTYGLHAKSTIMCWIVTIPLYIGGCLFIKYISLPSVVVYIIWMIGFISFLLWAPADTPARPLIHENKRRTQKLNACTLCFVFLLLILFYPNRILINTICYSLLVQSVCINPITYKLTHTTFDNYKVYNKKHGLN